MQSKVFIILAIVAFVAAKPTNVELPAAEEVEAAVEVQSDDNAVRCLNFLNNRGQRSVDDEAAAELDEEQAKFLCKTTSTTTTTTTTTAAPAGK